MQEKPSSDKMLSAVTKQIMPLYEVWCNKAKLTDLESKILFLKEFDDRKLNESEQLEILKEEFNYFYDLRTYQNLWKRIKKKIFKILP